VGKVAQGALFGALGMAWGAGAGAAGLGARGIDEGAEIGARVGNAATGGN
jgi:hypothetical protein